MTIPKILEHSAAGRHAEAFVLALALNDFAVLTHVREDRCDHIASCLRIGNCTPRASKCFKKASNEHENLPTVSRTFYICFPA